MNKWAHSVLLASVVERHGLHPHPALLGRLRCDRQCAAPAFRNTHVRSFHIFSSFLTISFSLSVIVTVVHFHALNRIRTDSHSIRSSRARGSSIAYITSHLSSDADILLYAASYLAQISLLIFIFYSMLFIGG
jgi:hypothetical protein